ncbi:MAG: peptidase C39 family protein [Candidatus Peribacteraceae bacterium]|nr:peptidase C39 family protein [Candidatus Peribacteraceae bacterium]
MVLRVPYFRQHTDYTCGPACVRMVLALHGKRVKERTLARSLKTNARHGTNYSAITALGRRIGFRFLTSSRATWRSVLTQIRHERPVLVCFIEPTSDESHYALVTGYQREKVLLHDPWNGKYFRMPLKDFKRRWLGYGTRSEKWGWMAVCEKKE